MYLLAVLLCALGVTAFTPGGSFVAWYKNRSGTYTISVGLAFSYSRCSALLHALTEAQVIDQILQDFSAAAYGKISAFAPTQSGYGNIWLPVNNHFGVITNHVVDVRSNIRVVAAAFALAEAYGIPGNAIYNSAPNVKRTDEWDVLDEVAVFMKAPSTVLTDDHVRALLQSSVEHEPARVNATVHRWRKREQFCANYNGASYKCIDWSHYVIGNRGGGSYTCSTGKADSFY